MPVDDAPTGRRLGSRRWLILGGVLIALVAIVVIVAVAAWTGDDDTPGAAGAQVIDGGTLAPRQIAHRPTSVALGVWP